MLTFCGLIIAAFVFAQQFALNNPGENFLMPEKAAFTWNSLTYNFGKLPVGVPVSHEFNFTNTGEIPLVISSVQASCGCTVTSYSKDPIPPGAQGFVSATYNAAKVGVFTKTVTVTANTDESAVVLTIQGEVVEQ